MNREHFELECLFDDLDESENARNESIVVEIKNTEEQIDSFEIKFSSVKKIEISKATQIKMEDGIRLVCDGSENYLILKNDVDNYPGIVLARILSVQKMNEEA